MENQPRVQPRNTKFSYILKLTKFTSGCILLNLEVLENIKKKKKKCAVTLT